MQSDGMAGTAVEDLSKKNATWRYLKHISPDECLACLTTEATFE
jgi:hypothetical protein